MRVERIDVCLADFRENPVEWWRGLPRIWIPRAGCDRRMMWKARTLPMVSSPISAVRFGRPLRVGRRGFRMTYDEDSELTRYLWRNHRRLLSAFERQVEQAVYASENFAAATDEHGSRIMARYGRSSDPRIDDALAAGLQAFRLSACHRILSECDDLGINRCPSCCRILRTPVARQCFWCGRDWHLGDV
jgi:hypothetical protein